MKKQMSGISHEEYLECPHPCVGKEYQAQLPSLLSPLDSYCKGWEDSEFSEWSDLEIKLFVVALYIFGKDLLLVKEFMDHGKDMNQIQSFYYGRFYNSNAYRMWAERRRSAVDRKPLAEGSMEKMFSLLHPLVPLEYRQETIEAHESTFHEETKKRLVSLMEYALLLKKRVGHEVLIEGVRRTVGGHNRQEAADIIFQVNDSSASAWKKKNLEGVGVDEGEANIGAKEKRVSGHVKRDSGPVKKRRSTKPNLKPIKDENVDHEVVNDDANEEISKSPDGRRRTRRSRVMSTKAVEAFETGFLGSG